MKLNKIYKYLSLALGFVLMVSCVPDNEPDIKPISHSILEVSNMFDNYTVNVNQEVTFADVSTGVVDRTWSLDDGVTAKVLKLDKDVPDILEIRALLRNRADLTPEELAIVEAKLLLGDQSVLPDYKDPFLKLSFETGGVYNINIKQEFEDFPFVEDEEVARDTKILDRVMTITVLERISILGLSVAELDAGGNPGTSFGLTYTGAGNSVFNVTQPAMVSAGSTVRISFAFGGNPDAVVVTSPGGTVVPNSTVLNTDGTGTVDIQYNAPGSYDLEFSVDRAIPATIFTGTFTSSITVN